MTTAHQAMLDRFEVLIGELHDHAKEMLRECRPIEIERDIFLELLRLPRSEMSDEDYMDYYSCIQNMLAAIESGKKGVEITMDWDKSPENYDGLCLCRLCRSYGD